MSGFHEDSRFYFIIEENKEEKYYIEKINEGNDKAIHFILKKYE